MPTNATIPSSSSTNQQGHRKSLGNGLSNPFDLELENRSKEER